MTGGPLDLSGADTTGLDPVPSRRYVLGVYEAEWTETKNEGKMPAGTPMYKVQFTINQTYPELEDEIDGIKLGNRRVFQNFFPVPPKGYDKDKAAKLKGSFVNFLVACGYDEDEITSGKFALDNEDLIGKTCVGMIGIQPASAEREAQNKVNGFKKEGAEVGSGGLL